MLCSHYHRHRYSYCPQHFHVPPPDLRFHEKHHAILGSLWWWCQLCSLEGEFVFVFVWGSAGSDAHSADTDTGSDADCDSAGFVLDETDSTGGGVELAVGRSRKHS